MAEVFEFKIISTGFPGAPGYTTLHMRPTDGFGVQTSFALAQQWSGAVGFYSPSLLTLNVDPVASVFDEATGELLRYEAADSGLLTPEVGTRGDAFGAGVAGLCFAWTTGGINRGRKIRGRTFMVPIAASAFEANGTIEPNLLGTTTATVDQMIQNAGGFGIWSRPINKLGGKFARVISGRVKDQAAYLSSRRN